MDTTTRCISKNSSPFQFQAIKTCEKLEENNEIGKLYHFLISLPREVFMAISQHESILRARVLVHFERQEYQVTLYLDSRGHSSYLRRCITY